MCLIMNRCIWTCESVMKPTCELLSMEAFIWSLKFEILVKPEFNDARAICEDCIIGEW